MRKLIAPLSASMTALAVLTTMAPGAQAATQFSPTHIWLNGKDITDPVHTAAVDPSSKQPTTFMPIYYAMQVLNKLGIQSSWDGTHWNLTVPSSITPNLGNPAASPNQMSISINGTVVQTAPKLVAKDPASGQDTTFIPIWYLSQVLNRLGITSTWDGTNWRLTQSKPVTQQDMANAMWQTFAGVTWDIQSHPSMADAGVSPTSAPVTAGDVATWLAKWASKSKGLIATSGPQKGQWIPYDLKYEVSSDPYTWASINGLFQDTSVTSPSSVINSADESTVLSNLQWWLTGDRVVNGVHHLHVPFYSNYGLWLTSTAPKPQSPGQSGGLGISESDYQAYLADETKYYDQVTATVKGNTIYLTLPDTSKSFSNMAWHIVDGHWVYGGWQAKDNRGGKTLEIPNAGTAGPTISTGTLNPSMYLEGFQIVYANVNGVPVFNQPYDWGEDQNPPSK
ncbi:hypothetical protein [Alicyclobacillus macrosporangiidus]|uniref:Copper amine oxidase N-terminal domain-containing protein n=1 Tax=Alicyclobacillus macrosporangiidus TaxID=392015 RepID=A0A1I7KDR1_9BACL|nr:hypothetical protein [Alicyclobacillus macrosporangiidus]SFU95545.1 hypothetical protein SAMN05421543_11557 [Alicyclobacillus macrosporangiidus]